MDDQQQLLKSLRDLMREIEIIQSRIAASATPEDRAALEVELQSLVNRKVAVEEEINQTTGALR